MSIPVERRWNETNFRIPSNPSLSVILRLPKDNFIKTTYLKSQGALTFSWENTLVKILKRLLPDKKHLSQKSSSKFYFDMLLIVHLKSLSEKRFMWSRALLPCAIKETAGLEQCKYYIVYCYIFFYKDKVKAV